MKIKNVALFIILLSSSVNHCTDQVENIFTKIFNTNQWGSRESISGPGSEVKFTQRTRRGLVALIKLFGITSIADAPCGDLNWIKHIDLGTCRYIGIDIVQNLIERNKTIFGPTREFQHLNLIEDVIEKVDLIICRDMLAHLTDEQIFTVLRNFKKSGSKYLLVTSNPTTTVNNNGTTGDWRSINFELPPFIFPRPIAMIKEDVPFTFELGKHLVLWKLEDINV